jgi:hypothetical protein
MSLSNLYGQQYQVGIGMVTLSAPQSGTGIAGTYHDATYTDKGSISYSPSTGLTVQFASYTNPDTNPTYSYSHTFLLHP